MAHEITTRKNSFVEFAFSGERKHIWHSLGQEMEAGKSIDEWKTAAGMDWNINSSPLMYNGKADIIVDDSKQILHRSDTEELLGIVSKDYKIVQPGEVLEFFRDLTEIHGMKLSAAGTLFGGKRFWCTAELGKSVEIVEGDVSNGYLLLVSSADGTTSTISKFCAERVICNNTLQIALNESSKNVVKVTHASAFDPKKVKIDMGLLDTAWEKFISNMRLLTTKKTTDDQARDFFAKLITPTDSVVDMELLRTQRHVDAMMHFFKNGAGAEFAPGTQYQTLQAVTEFYTHGNGKRDASTQFNNSELGDNAKMKTLALNRLLQMA